MVQAQIVTLPETLRRGVHALLEKKGEDLLVLDVRELSSITDFLVIASGTSSPHLRALRSELESEFKEHGIDSHIEGNDLESGWLVVDAFDVMIHLFHPSVRDHFQLERLWRDAPEISLETLGFQEGA